MTKYVHDSIFMFNAAPRDGCFRIIITTTEFCIINICLACLLFYVVHNLFKLREGNVDYIMFDSQMVLFKPLSE